MTIDETTAEPAFESLMYVTDSAEHVSTMMEQMMTAATPASIGQIIEEAEYLAQKAIELAGELRTLRDRVAS